jgi:hypothetical protein
MLESHSYPLTMSPLQIAGAQNAATSGIELKEVLMHEDMPTRCVFLD